METQAKYLDDKFKDEDPCDNIINKLKYLCFLSILRVVIDWKSYGVYANKEKYRNNENLICTYRMEKLV